MGIKVSLEKTDDDLWILENKELRIVGVGETLEEARRRFVESLQIAIEGYVFEKDENLTEKARELKKKLKELME